MYFVPVAVFAAAGLLQAAPFADSAVFDAFSHADANVAHFAVLQRAGVTDDLDVVVVIGAAQPFPNQRDAWVWWTEDRTVGLFFQEKVRPDRVYSLGTRSGFPDCAARVERVTSTDTVISCRGEKSEPYPNQKWTYAASTKKPIRQFSYWPFSMVRAFSNANGVVFVGSDTERLIAVKYRPEREPAFRVLSPADAQPWIARMHGSTEDDKNPVPVAIPPLPRTTYDEFAAARPARVKNGYLRTGTELHDSIGPWQRQDGRIWFGKTFYDGEGSTGVGGIGYFDLNERKLHMLALPAVADFSISALDAEPDAVWLALVQNGEYGGRSGGVLRYDLTTNAVRRYDLPDIAVRLIRSADTIVAATDFGFAVIGGDHATRFFVDASPGGTLRVVPATVNHPR